MPDTGATRTIVHSTVAAKLHAAVTPTDVLLRAADGGPLQTEGSCQLRLGAAQQSILTEALVSPSITDELIVGWPDLQALGIIARDFPNPGTCAAVSDTGAPPGKAVWALFEKYSGVFTVRSMPPSPMAGGLMKIHLRPGPVTPKRVLTARQIPLHLREKAEELIQNAIEDGVIVPVNEPSEWISPAHFVPKPHGRGVRMVTDYTTLNKYVQRPVHPFPSAADIFNSLDPTATIFCTLDAVSGYFQIPLDEPSSRLTTFLLPAGRFRYTRAPMGLNASSDEWCRRSDEALVGLQGVLKIVDDILVSAASERELATRVEAVLQRCQAASITLSRKKARVDSEVLFAGFVVSASGVKPDEAKLAAIRDFPRPTDVRGVRAFLGLCNQLGSFVPDLAHACDPLRLLLRKDTAFNWLEAHEQAFCLTKGILTSSPVVQRFVPELPTVVVTDASRLKGLGFALLQRHQCGNLRLVQCGSRSLSPTESRYATIELEMLGIAWALEKCRFYLLGLPEFSVLTDHRPLVGIFKKSLDDVGNPRLLRMRERTAAYSFVVSWTEGKTHFIADALSRNPVWSCA